MKPLTFKDIMPRTLSVPPVTGVGGSNGPYANLYDQSGFFRDRSGSQKRRRRDGQDELLDSVFDLTRDFPPTNPPPRPALDVASIKSTLVEATAMAEVLRPIIEREDDVALTPSESKALVRTLLKLVTVVEGVVEGGIEPLSAAVVGVGGGVSGRRFAAAARRLNAPPPPPSLSRARGSFSMLSADPRRSRSSSVRIWGIWALHIGGR